MTAAPVPHERAQRRRLNGVVLVDKPTGLSSNAALQRVKRAYRAEKAGHTGTLDPLASGLLPICLGEATKFSNGLLDAGKRYRAVVHLGVQTETGDAEGAILTTRAAPADFALIAAALERFRGDIRQTPHRYSALKREGRPLYSYARAGEEVAIAPRDVRIERLDVESWESPLLTIDVECSKGTYIRSLAEDIGDVLGCGAHVAALRRTGVGQLLIEQATTLDAIEAASEAVRDAWLQPLSLLVAGLPWADIDDQAADRFLHGQRVAIEVAGVAPGARVAVSRRGGAHDRGFLGIARLESVAGSDWLLPVRVIAVA